MNLSLLSVAVYDFELVSCCFRAFSEQIFHYYSNKRSFSIWALFDAGKCSSEFKKTAVVILFQC